MKQDQVLDSCFLRDFHAFEPRGVSPSLARSGQLFGSKLRVVDENVRSGGKFQQALVELRIARFVVGGIDHGSGGRLKAKTEAPLRVVQPARRHARARHVKLISAADLGKFPRR